MSFIHEVDAWPAGRILSLMESARPEDVERAIAAKNRTPEDLAALMSPAARAFLEPMAREANRLTRWHFGRTIGLYAPIYISNVCHADCLYCGYAAKSGCGEERRTLTLAETESECEALASHGFQHVLLLTGEAPRVVPPEAVADAVRVARKHFPSVSVEIYALEEDEYALLHAAGLEGVTLYMETYDRATYALVHKAGKKRDYQFRLDALERAGRAGVRRIGLGALLGLHDWRTDGFLAALHGRYLQRVCWRSAISVSFPRLRHTPTRFPVPHLLSDPEMVRLLLAIRLFLPEAGFYLSTREPAEFRDKLIPLGITSMSAGSSTRPGGYVSYGEETLEQFEIEDDRTPVEVVQAIRDAGYDPVWKDFDQAFDLVR